MATPPFNLDTTDPSDTGIVAQFPANERTFRDNLASYLNTEHDINTGYHKFQSLTTTQKSNLSSPPSGMLVYDTTAAQLQVNTGTPSAPVWTPTIVGNPAGTIIDFAGTTAPQGYLNCDGSAVSRTTYANLFAAIGITWGNGDGVSTFNLPNLNRRATVGSGGTGTSILGNAVGNTGGEEAHTQSVAEMPVHNHTLTDPGHVHTYPGSAIPVIQPGGSFTANSGSALGATAIPSATTGITIASAGSGTAFNIIQPSAVVLKCIKT